MTRMIKDIFIAITFFVLGITIMFLFKQKQLSVTKQIGSSLLNNCIVQAHINMEEASNCKAAYNILNTCINTNCSPNDLEKQLQPLTAHVAIPLEEQAILDKSNENLKQEIAKNPFWIWK